MGISTEEEFAGALAKARAAAAAYYDTSELLMSDAEYDALIAEIEDAQERHGWDSGGLLDAVAGGQSRGGELEHPSPMGSLEKVRDLAELRQWCQARTGPLLVEPKLDGMAIRAVYREGNLSQVVTRGDGTSGEDVTAACGAIGGLPTAIAGVGDLELRGEVYMTDKDFEVSNEARVQSGKPAFANPRNAVAGTLRNTKATYAAAMTFACYGTWPENALSDDHQETVRVLDQWGVGTAAQLWPSNGAVEPDAICQEVERLGQERDQLGFPIDGAVIKEQLHENRVSAGYGTKAPKWAIAYKYAPAEATSVLREIEVSVGRTGRMTLRAVIDPVDVGGTTITYATLHNPAFVTSQGLGIGSTVMVVRAGDVIPRVTAAVGATSGPAAPWEPPAACPQCAQTWDKSSLLWRCTTPECSVTERIIYAVSRACLDIDGMSDAICTALVTEGKVCDLADLFTLSTEDIAQAQLGLSPAGAARRVGNTNAKKVMRGIENARSLPTDRFVAALGLGGVGPTLARRIARNYPTLESLKEASQESLAAIDGIGTEKALAILSSLESSKTTIAKLIGLGIGTQAAGATDAAPAAQSLTGMRIAVSGAMDGELAGLNRDQMRELIERHGGTSVGSVTSRTTHLVTKETTTTKAIQARELGVSVLSPQEFSQLLT